MATMSFESIRSAIIDHLKERETSANDQKERCFLLCNTTYFGGGNEHVVIMARTSHGAILAAEAFCRKAQFCWNGDYKKTNPSCMPFDLIAYGLHNQPARLCDFETLLQKRYGDLSLDGFFHTDKIIELLTAELVHEIVDDHLYNRSAITGLHLVLAGIERPTL